MASKKSASRLRSGRKALHEKPAIPHLDPLEAVQESLRCAQEGNAKLQGAIEALREALETIVVAEVDRRTGLPVSALELRSLAVQGLDAYSQLTGQSWRRTKLRGSFVGDRSLPSAAESEASL